MSVRKRTWTTRGEKREAWIVDYKDSAGKRHIETFARKKEADSAHRKIKGELASGTHTPDRQSITIAEAGDLWLATCREELERATVDSYVQHLDLHIKPYLGTVKLSQLNAPMVRAWEDALLAGAPAPGQSERSPRSAKMVRRCRISLGALIGDAQDRGLVARNVVKESNSRRRAKRLAKARRESRKLEDGIDIPYPDEMRLILNAAKAQWRPLLLVAALTGLRASELRGLRWQDVDLHKRELHVRQRADKYNDIGSPKSEAGQRTVPLSPLVLNALREWKLKCPKGDLGLVFPNGSGNIESHSNIVQRGLEPTVRAAGVTKPVLGSDGQPTLDERGNPVLEAKYTGLHAFRHFFASWCINAKQDGGLELSPKRVQYLMGHSTIVLTMDRYGHLFPRKDDGSELADAEARLLGHAT